MQQVKEIKVGQNCNECNKKATLRCAECDHAVCIEHTAEGGVICKMCDGEK